MSVRAGLFLLCLALCLATASLALARPVRKDHPHERQEFFRLRRVPVGETAIPVDRYFAALRRMRTMRQHSLRLRDFLPSREELARRRAASGSSAVEEAPLGTWSPLGPGNIGGRTRALIVDPKSPETLYAGGVAGGVWKSTDGGLSWAALDDFAANLAVASLAMDPSRSNIVYAGTGEGFYNDDAVRGAGIFKTTDGGLTWNQLPSTNNRSFYYVNDLAVSPKDPRRVYAATRTGVWRSKDGGTTWTRVLAPKVHGGCLDLALRTDAATDFLFAACGTREGTAGVWSNPAAERRGGWERVLTEPDMGRTSLAIAPSDQDVIYALASTNARGTWHWGLHAVFRSGDGGKSWSAQVRNTDPDPLNRMLLTNAYFALPECNDPSFFNQGWYDNVIAVDPVNPDRVWAGGIDLFRSDDGGKSWGVMSYWFTDEEGQEGSIHADQHALVFHPDYDGRTVKTLFATNDGGVFKTLDALAPPVTNPADVCDPGKATFRWESLNNGLGVTQFYYGLPYPDGATWFGGTQDNGVVRGNSPVWETLLFGDAGYVAVDPNDTDVLYASLTNLSIYKATDGASNFEEAMTGINQDDKFLFVTPLVMDPSDSKRLWTGGVHLWRTDDAAASWKKASDRLSGAASTIAVFPGDPDRVLVGTRKGDVHRTSGARASTGTTVWPSSRPRKGFVSSVAFDPRNPDTVYATYSSFGGIHVWKSVDGGATWTGIDGTGKGAIPDLPVNAIVVDPADSRRLFLATDLGVFVSKDGGANWAVENTGFANVPTSWLAILEGPSGSRTLFAFTHGRGAWKIALD